MRFVDDQDIESPEIFERGSCLHDHGGSLVAVVTRDRFVAGPGVRVRARRDDGISVELGQRRPS
jgi:hypothetical protein